jgi:hypothetical protein
VLQLMPADGDAMMIQCDKCNVWQHGPCVGIWADEEAPDGRSLCHRLQKTLTSDRVFLREMSTRFTRPVKTMDKESGSEHVSVFSAGTPLAEQS